MDGYVSEVMSASRILSHGKISSLSAGFSLKGDRTFSIFIIPKTLTETEPVIVNVKCFKDDVASGCPFVLRWWSEPVLIEIGVDAIDLNDYDVYWGAGGDVLES